MGSDNPTGADNQQETGPRALDPMWVVGVVDGETVSVSIHRNRLAKPTFGWHVQPTFQVSQHRDNGHALRRLQQFFSCGSARNKGRDNPVHVYVVHSTRLLVERMIPFFERHPLLVKHDDFVRFAAITRHIRSRAHHRPEVFEEVVRLAYAMSAHGKQRKRPISDIVPGSSETAR